MLIAEQDVRSQPRSNGGANGLRSHSSDALRVTEFIPGKAPRRLDGLDELPAENAVRWVDVDVLQTDLETLQETLPRLCPGICTERIVDLFERDPVPKVEQDDDGEIRAVSAVSVKAQAPEHPENDEGRPRAGSLVFQLVEIVSNEHWLITCWHRERIYGGIEQDTTADLVSAHAEIESAVAKRWHDLGAEHARTAGDLGVLLLSELADTYERARLELYAWLDSWELDFLRRSSNDEIHSADQIDRRTLIDLRAMASEFRCQVHPLDVPRTKAQQAFFSNVCNTESPRRVDEVIEHTLRDLKELTGRVRSAFDLVQLQLTDIQGRKAEGLQRKLEVVASIFLAPTLIAGFFGANTWLPGGNDPHAQISFEVMVATMLVGSFLAYFGIRHFMRKDHA